jgi:hypothetical protein
MIFLLHQSSVSVQYKNSSKERLIIYNTANVISTLRKHVLPNHSEIANVYEKEMNKPLKEELKRQHVKKSPNLSRVTISNFLYYKRSFQKG